MSETDDPISRRPPTIELAATEVDDSAAQPAAGEAEAAAHGAEDRSAAASAAAPRSTGTRVKSHIAGAALGAAVMAAIVGALWFAGLLPARNMTPGQNLAANTSSTVSSAPTSPPMAPSTVAPNNPAAPELNARLDKIERAIEAPHTDPALAGRLAGFEAQTKSLGDAVAALQRRSDDIAATGADAAKQADAALNAATAAKSASESASEAARETATKTELRRSDLDMLASRIAALESAVKGLAAATAPLTSSGADDRSARLTVAAEALRAAVERGTPYQNELAAVRALGADANATAPLDAFAASGVPTDAALARELDALMPALQAAAQPAPADATFLNRLRNNAEKLVRITSAGAPPGSDPAAVIGRIRFNAAHGDIAAALTDIDALPDQVKSLAAAWRKTAAARQAAVAASGQIASDALAALGRPPAQ